LSEGFQDNGFIATGAMSAMSIATFSALTH
jgi:hypothetical protein